MTYRRSEDRYLDEEYENKIAVFVESQSDEQLSTDDVQSQFVEKCELFEEYFKHGTPLLLIRRIAFRKVTQERAEPSPTTQDREISPAPNRASVSTGPTIGSSQGSLEHRR